MLIEIFILHITCFRLKKTINLKLNVEIMSSFKNQNLCYDILHY